MLAQTKMAFHKKVVTASYIFVQDVMDLIGVVEQLIVRLLLFGIFLYGVVQVIRHL